MILYNTITYDIIYINITHNNDINAKCDSESCTCMENGQTHSSNIQSKCKIYKTDNMILNKQYKI